MAASKTNFFKDHYDWLVAAVGLAVFAGVAVLFVTSLDSSPEAARAACEKELMRTPAHKDVPAADLSLFNKVRNGMESPSLLVVPSDKEGNFLASECRVFCQNPDRAACHKPIPFKSKECPFCGFKQPSAESADVVRGGVDADKDGIPDAWELKYGLNPNDPEDAKKDLDGDSFTNLEEFEANTDPKNPDSHPEFLDFLAVAGQLNVESLKFCFDRADATSSNPKDGDWRITFSLLRDFAKEKGFNARVSTMVGKEIVFQSARPKIVKGKMIYDEVQSGWRVVKYNKKEELVAKKGSEQKVRMDVSTVDLERISDKRMVSMQVGTRKPVAIEEQIDLVWNRGEGKKFTVTAGREFTLANRKYKVKKFAKDGNACKVTVEDLDKKTEKIIQ